MSKIIKCDCKHEFQDKTYGHMNRIHTEGTKGFTCTVCGKMNTESNTTKIFKRKK